MDARNPDPVIILCPCCGSVTDTLSDVTEHNCPHCGQQWTMVIDADRLQRFALR